MAAWPALTDPHIFYFLILPSVSSCYSKDKKHEGRLIQYTITNTNSFIHNISQMSEAVGGMPLLSGPPPVGVNIDSRSEMSCRKCNKEFNLLFARGRRCNHCGV